MANKTTKTKRKQTDTKVFMLIEQELLAGQHLMVDVTQLSVEDAGKLMAMVNKQMKKLKSLQTAQIVSDLATRIKNIEVHPSFTTLWNTKFDSRRDSLKEYGLTKNALRVALLPESETAATFTTNIGNKKLTCAMKVRFADIFTKSK